MQGSLIKFHILFHCLLDGGQFKAARSDIKKTKAAYATNCLTFKLLPTVTTYQDSL